MDNRAYIALGVVIAIFIGFIAYMKINAPPEVTSDGSNNIYGKLDSKVTLTEYVDFQCGACYAYYPTVKAIKEQYKDRVKFQIKYFPISNAHKFARMSAANAEAAARQGKFFEMHDKIFEGQKTWELSQTPQENFDSYAKELGLNMEQFKADILDKKTMATINADLDEVRRLGGEGTPTFTLNGKKIESPANSIEAFSSLLDQALKENN